MSCDAVVLALPVTDSLGLRCSFVWYAVVGIRLSVSLITLGNRNIRPLKVAHSRNESFRLYPSFLLCSVNSKTRLIEVFFMVPMTLS